MRSITPGQCDDYKLWLLDKYAAATASRQLKTAKPFLRAAVRKGPLTQSPFADVKAGAQNNRSRGYFISQDDIAKVLDACPNAEWRTIFALSCAPPEVPSSEAVQKAVQQTPVATSSAPQSAPHGTQKPRENQCFSGFDGMSSWPPRI